MGSIMSSDIIKRFIELLAEQQPVFAENCAFSIELQLRHEFAGERIYIPKHSGHLHDEIAQRFNGRNVGKLARELRVSRRTVYRAVHARKKPKGDDRG